MSSIQQIPSVNAPGIPRPSQPASAPPPNVSGPSMGSDTYVPSARADRPGFGVAITAPDEKDVSPGVVRCVQRAEEGLPSASNPGFTKLKGEAFDKAAERVKTLDDVTYVLARTGSGLLRPSAAVTALKKGLALATTPQDVTYVEALTRECARNPVLTPAESEAFGQLARDARAKTRALLQAP